LSFLLLMRQSRLCLDGAGDGVDLGGWMNDSTGRIGSQQRWSGGGTVKIPGIVADSLQITSITPLTARWKRAEIAVLGQFTD
jgi:hypothetical protein